MIRRLLSATILGFAAIPLGATSAEPPVTHQDVTRTWADAWNSHDITKVLALFAKDIQIDQPENAKPLDYNGARKFFSMIFRAYPDFHVAVLQAIVDGRSAVSVERVTGTWTGPFVNPANGKATPGNGRHFDHPGAMVLLYDANGKIRHVSIYWDQLTVDRQLGLIPR
ncbi:MAG: ester cyclase [Candidatus Cybelea sp.]